MLKFLLVFVVLIETNFVSAELKGTKLIIDNDAGGDDAMAIFLALLYEKHNNGPKLVGLTTGNGNTKEENVCLNNQRILKVAGRQDVPIYRGSKSSTVTTPATNAYYGEDGLGDNVNDDMGLQPAQTQDAVTFLIEQSKAHEGELIVITIGTLTNLALAIKLDPEFIDRLAHLYVGAGHIHDEHIPGPEFNALMDAEAYHIVTQHANPDKVTVFPFSQVKRTLNISKSWRLDVFGTIDTNIVRAQNLYERISIPRNKMWHALDPAVVAVAVRPDLVEEYKYSKNSIVLCGDDRGLNKNVMGEKENANVRMVHSVNEEEYKKFLIDLFSADLKNQEK